MELLCTLTSPYARKVRIAILERGLEPRVTVRLVNPLDDAPGFHAVAPFGKVPVLVDDHGRAVFDSRVIEAFLDTLDAPGPTLRPADPELALEDARLEALADGILDCAVPVVMERWRPEAERSPGFLRRQIDKIRRGVAALAAAAPTAPALDDAPTHGVIATGCALRYLGFRLGDEPKLALPSPLGDLRDHLEARPSFTATAPPEG